MRNVFQALLISFSLTCSVWAAGNVVVPESAGGDTTVITEAEGAKNEQKKHKYGVFLVVFLISILFVLSSATALKRMGGGKPAIRGKSRPSRKHGSQGKLPEGEKRFRL